LKAGYTRSNLAENCLAGSVPLVALQRRQRDKHHQENKGRDGEHQYDLDNGKALFMFVCDNVHKDFPPFLHELIIDKA
jgi:hypothetical protein